MILNTICNVIYRADLTKFNWCYCLIWALQVLWIQRCFLWRTKVMDGGRPVSGRKWIVHMLNCSAMVVDFAMKSFSGRILFFSSTTTSLKPILTQGFLKHIYRYPNCFNLNGTLKSRSNKIFFMFNIHHTCLCSRNFHVFVRKSKR